MSRQALIAGGGIGGLAAALACTRAGWNVRLCERAAAFAEVGAGIQIGPNVTRLLHAWGLETALAAVAAFPSHLQVRNATSGRALAVLRLDAMRARYGAPYASIHRADLHALLLDAVVRQGGTELRLNTAIAAFSQTGNFVQVQCAPSAGALSAGAEGDVLIGADGLWSAVRQGLLNDGPPRLTGHLAYRALVPESSLPAALRSAHVTAWLGPDMHLVTYPVRRGEWRNLVAIVHGAPPDAAQGGTAGDGARWDDATDAGKLRNAMARCCTPLRDLVAAVPEWRMWVMLDRPPMQGPGQHAAGRVALLGDAAHPMRPYLAQGAGMAIEDAACLAQALAQSVSDVPAALQAYALHRWSRNARVQARALRNGRIFHARGIVRVGRDIALGLLGERLLDMPWLYGGVISHAFELPR